MSWLDLWKCTSKQIWEPVGWQGWSDVTIFKKKIGLNAKSPECSPSTSFTFAHGKQLWGQDSYLCEADPAARPQVIPVA